MSKEAMKLALDALEGVWKGGFSYPPQQHISKAITALREALAEQPAPVQQEPEIEYCTNYHCAGDCGQPHNQKEMREFLAAAPKPAQQEQLREENERLHVENRRLIDRIETIGVSVGVGGIATTTAQRTWVGLTDDEIYSVLENLQIMHHRPPTTDSRVIFARAIEAKLKEENT